jgi:endonuclease YncB( thermonuclease family)
MRSRTSLLASAVILVLATVPAAQSHGAGATVRDGNNVQIADVTFRLDGIEAPAFDQMCIDEHADSWACGAAARDQLTKLIGDRQVRCEDLGVDPSFKRRRLGVCTVEGEAASLNQLMVHSGFALADAKGKFKSEETGAHDDKRGLWKGCFVTPTDFRRWRKDAALQGGACRGDRDREIREALFPDDPAMPAGCNIKGKYAVRARVTGNTGIYHLQTCRSYPGLDQDRWFCSEDDALAAGFRKAYNCRRGLPAK